MEALLSAELVAAGRAVWRVINSWFVVKAPRRRSKRFAIMRSKM